MRKINLTLAAFLLVLPAALAQNSISVFTNAKEVGTNLATGKSIIAAEYTLPERIHDFQIDTVNNYLTLQLRGLSGNGRWLKNKGSVVRYAPEKKKVLWSKKIAYHTARIEQYGGITLHTTGGKSFCLENETGERKWEARNTLIFADPIDKIGIGYKIKAIKGNDNTLEGIDLNSGKAIWQREINREYSWNDVFYLDDSTLLIAAAGLHTVNIYDGSGWDYHAVTGKKDYTAAAVGTGLGIAAGLLTGTYSVASGYDLVRDVASNIIIDSLHFYFASKENLVKLSRNGRPVWQTALPADLTSKSWIFKEGENLIMVNTGHAFMGHRQLDFGTPFIASFNIETGERNYLATVSLEKKEMIRDFYVDGNRLLLSFGNRVSEFFPESGAVGKDKAVALDGDDVISQFVGGRLFVRSGDSFKSLVENDSASVYLFTKSGKILKLNQNLDVESEMHFDDVYVYYLTRNNLKFIAKENETFIIDESGAAVAEVAASRNSILLNGKLYHASGRSFLEIDLTELVGE